MPEDEIWQMILSPLGEPWSGRARYAAAMALYRSGHMDAETLEIYRRLSRLDHEDPVAVLTRHQMGADWIATLDAAQQRLIRRSD